ncbi:hypothetical protein [Pantoea sp. CTOTU46764]|uniref:hypothetical protein n=1 Tax=Pantoea sp. CTOTU46764 TaxID=2953854 RepID=UPI0028A0752D|nr:hypothetical protein [Pantoea sp. CTOTU46764]
MESQEKKIYNVATNDIKHKDHDKNKDAYRCWYNMLKRCYSGENVNYKDITVCSEWLVYSSFLKWYEDNFIPRYHLDKDIIISGSAKRVYSPETCLFVHHKVNLTFRVRDNVTGYCGVKINGNGYQAQISSNGELSALGTYNTASEAHVLWQKEKIIHIKRLIEEFENETALCVALNAWVKVIEVDIKSGRKTVLH